MRGEPLLVLELSNRPGQEEAKPNFIYIVRSSLKCAGSLSCYPQGLLLPLGASV